MILSCVFRIKWKKIVVKLCLLLRTYEHMDIVLYVYMYVDKYVGQWTRHDTVSNFKQFA